MEQIYFTSKGTSKLRIPLLVNSKWAMANWVSGTRDYFEHY